MSRKTVPLRFEILEDRMMLSVNVSVADNTVFVNGNGDDDYVTIRQADHHYLVVKDHEQVVETIDLRQFDNEWNLNVYLDGGDDHLRISDVYYRLRTLQVDTGGELGTLNGNSYSDNDTVKISGVSARHIRIDTGASVNQLQTPEVAAVEFNEIPFGVSYYDNDRVYVYDSSTYGGDLVVRTGTEVFVNFGSVPTVASGTEGNGDGEHPYLVDNDYVEVKYVEIDHGNLDIETGTRVHMGVWHDNHDDAVVSAATHDGGEVVNGGIPTGISLEDRDRVYIKMADVSHGNLYVNTGFDLNIAVDVTDELKLVDAVMEGFEPPIRQIYGQIDDSDSVSLYRVKVGDRYATHSVPKIHENTLLVNGVETGSVRIHTGANIHNNDPWSYLALQLYDNDHVYLKSVRIYGSLDIWTGMNRGGQIGDPTNGDGQHDQDHVTLKYVLQLNREASTVVSLGDDNDYLYICYSSFYGSAYFNGGDGENMKKVRHSHFAMRPMFVNFGNHEV